MRIRHSRSLPRISQRATTNASRHSAPAQALVNIPPPPDPPFDIDTFEPIDPPWTVIREWIPADVTDPQAVLQEDIVSTHWAPNEIRLDDDRTLNLDPVLNLPSRASIANPAAKKILARRNEA